MNRVGVVARMALGGLLFAACGSGTGDGFAVITDRQATASYAITATVPEMLAKPSSYDLTIVEGSITRVDDGAGMTWTFDENGENEQREILSFKDEAAMARSVHVTMTVDSFIAGAPPEEPDVRFGLVIYRVGDAEVLRDGLVGETFIAFLTNTAVFDYEANLYGVLFDGGLLCRRGDDQPLECPALEDGLAERLDISSVSVEKLLPHGGVS